MASALAATPLLVSPKAGGIIRRSVLSTSFSSLFVLLVYSPLLAGTYSCKPTYSTSNIGCFTAAIKNSWSVLNLRRAGVTASITTYTGTNTETFMAKEICSQNNQNVILPPSSCHFHPRKMQRAGSIFVLSYHNKENYHGKENLYQP